MLKALSCLSWFLAPGCASASQSQAHQAGQSFASSLNATVVGAAKSTSPHSVPGFKTNTPKEASLDAHSLGDAALGERSRNEAAQHLITQSKDRQSFKIDPSTDPLLKSADEAIVKPAHTISQGKIVQDSGENIEAQEQKVVCEESGEETIDSGEETRIVIVKRPPKHKLQVQVYSHGWPGGLSRNVITGEKLDASVTPQYTTHYAAYNILHNPLPAHLQNRVKSIEFASGFSCPDYISLSPGGVLSVRTSTGWGWFFIDWLTVNIDVFLKPGKENVSETIKSTCGSLEERVEQGLCAYDSEVILEGAKTKVINDYPVTRDWWR